MYKAIFQKEEKKVKKRIAWIVTFMMIMSTMLTACGSDTNATTGAETTTTTTEVGTEATSETTDTTEIRVGSLKGATSIGLVSLMDKAQKEETANPYQFQMETGADVLLAGMMKGDLDIALLPANVASILYQKSEGKISVIDINTLSVLYMVSSDESLNTLESLKGKTVVLTGKGTTPDYTLQYLLSTRGMTTEDVKLEYKSEATEVVAALAQGNADIGLLPQPFVTAACAQNENLKVVLDFAKEWEDEKAQGTDGGKLVTGVTVVRKEFAEQHPDAVKAFLAEHKESAAFANENVKEAAELVAKQGIIEKAPIAEKAIPNCNITCIDGEEMKTALSGYLEVLHGMDPAMVGGKLPADDFYYIP